jgi:hypothetical protein
MWLAGGSLPNFVLAPDSNKNTAPRGYDTSECNAAAANSNDGAYMRVSAT